MNFKSQLRLFGLIICLSLLCLVVNLPNSFTLFGRTFQKPPLRFQLGPVSIYRPTDLKFGLDLAGGAVLTYQIDTANLADDKLKLSLESLRSVIEKRVNLFGLNETSVQIARSGSDHRLIIELPGISNIDEAISLLGRTAQLEFRGVKEIPPEATATATMDDVFVDLDLDGSSLTQSSVVYSPNTGKPEVSLQFNADGATKFAQATKDYLNRRIAIFLDGEIITAPTVQSVITDGQAVINGDFDIKQAKSLSIQLNAGALPLSLDLISQNTIGATLGQESIQKGIRAGIVGIILVFLFMIGNYGYLGLISCLGLIIYGLITLALYRLIPITLTFPGIVGFILSVGMAVDSNILIFERFKEEIANGRPWNQAMELGFGRAWDSIKDANTCTIITGLILLNPLNWSILNTSGLIRGFAVTLLLGIVISLFTGVVVTRTLLRVLARHKL